MSIMYRNTGYADAVMYSTTDDRRKIDEMLAILGKRNHRVVSELGIDNISIQIVGIGIDKNHKPVVFIDNVYGGDKIVEAIGCRWEKNGSTIFLNDKTGNLVREKSMANMESHTVIRVWLDPTDEEQHYDMEAIEGSNPRAADKMEKKVAAVKNEAAKIGDTFGKLKSRIGRRVAIH